MVIISIFCTQDALPYLYRQYKEILPTLDGMSNTQCVGVVVGGVRFVTNLVGNLLVPSPRLHQQWWNTEHGEI